ncbi:MAG: hypothetical protein KAI66_26560 [Lentisphaeria bacterium]|nr:hypothetical protein [Lentisphaeria bacterium]
MSKKMIALMLQSAVVAAQSANSEFAECSEEEARTLVGMQLRKALPGIVAGACGSTQDEAVEGIKTARAALDEAVTDKKSRAKDD